jgi:hypothetical protein
MMPGSSPTLVQSTTQVLGYKFFLTAKSDQDTSGNSVSVFRFLMFILHSIAMAAGFFFQAAYWKAGIAFI